VGGDGGSSGGMRVLMVAEKPSIAAALASALAEGSSPSKRKSMVSGASPPVFEYDAPFHALGSMPAHFKVTSTTGHMFSLDFPPEYNNTQQVQPADLFRAPTVHMEDPRPAVSKHLAQEAQDCDVLVLWLDCDREGENICFEVISVARPSLRSTASLRPDGGGGLPGAWMGNVYRAHFSSLAPQDLAEAMMRGLTHPNYNESRSVDARQVIDLKLGVAFSRFQTRYFRANFGTQLGKSLSVTYGPCQSPTLWFCVQRHDQIATFVPRPYWRVQASVDVSTPADQEDRGGHGPVLVSCASTRGDIWNHSEASAAAASALSSSTAQVLQVAVSRDVRARPLPLNTTDMLRAASDTLGIGPGDAMHLAERLYLAGYTTYPRTETSKYAPAFDTHAVLTALRGAADWLPHAQSSHSSSFVGPRDDGHDAGDHPPITPTAKLGTPKGCGDGWTLYQLICRTFVASLSLDAIFSSATTTFLLGGGETFTASVTVAQSRGWMDVMNVPMFSYDEEEEARQSLAAQRAFSAMSRLRLQVGVADSVAVHVRMAEPPAVLALWTAPPPHLSESDLISLMEAHGIGTDASMATHISNIERRGFVTLDPGTRQLVPTALGLALIHAYTLIDEGLVLPCVRSAIESEVRRIAEGEASMEEVVGAALRNFEARFHHFVGKAYILPLMFAVALNPVAAQGALHVSHSSSSTLAGSTLWEQAQARSAEIRLADLLDPGSAVSRAALRIPRTASNNAYGFGGGGGGFKRGLFKVLGGLRRLPRRLRKCLPCISPQCMRWRKMTRSVSWLPYTPSSRSSGSDPRQSLATVAGALILAAVERMVVVEAAAGLRKQASVKVGKRKKAIKRKRKENRRMQPRGRVMEARDWEWVGQEQEDAEKVTKVEDTMAVAVAGV